MVTRKLPLLAKSDAILEIWLIARTFVGLGGAICEEPQHPNKDCLAGRSLQLALVRDRYSLGPRSGAFAHSESCGRIPQVDAGHRPSHIYRGSFTRCGMQSCRPEKVRGRKLFGRSMSTLVTRSIFVTVQMTQDTVVEMDVAAKTTRLAEFTAPLGIRKCQNTRPHQFRRDRPELERALWLN